MNATGLSVGSKSSGKGVQQGQVGMQIRRRGSFAVCPVCLEIFQPMESITIITCGHAFHWKCVEPWLDRKARCPCCRWGANRSWKSSRTRLLGWTTERKSNKHISTKEIAARPTRKVVCVVAASGMDIITKKCLSRIGHPPVMLPLVSEPHAMNQIDEAPYVHSLNIGMIRCRVIWGACRPCSLALSIKSRRHADKPFPCLHCRQRPDDDNDLFGAPQAFLSYSLSPRVSPSKTRCQRSDYFPKFLDKNKVRSATI